MRRAHNSPMRRAIPHHTEPRVNNSQATARTPFLPYMSLSLEKPTARPADTLASAFFLQSSRSAPWFKVTLTHICQEVSENNPWYVLVVLVLDRDGHESGRDDGGVEAGEHQTRADAAISPGVSWSGSRDGELRKTRRARTLLSRQSAEWPSSSADVAWPAPGSRRF